MRYSFYCSYNKKELPLPLNNGSPLFYHLSSFLHIEYNKLIISPKPRNSNPEMPPVKKYIMLASEIAETKPIRIVIKPITIE